MPSASSPFFLSELMGYFAFRSTDAGTTLTGTKLVASSGDFSQADDKYEISTPGGQFLNIDEAGADTAAWATAGVSFSTTTVETMTLTSASLTSGFPTASNTGIYTDYTKATAAAGSAVTLGEGAYGVLYNNETAGSFRVHLIIPTALGNIDTLADAVINCQCNCSLDEAKAQDYIKARAYLDLIQYKADTATGFADMAEINTMLTTLNNFLAGTDELCGSC